MPATLNSRWLRKREVGGTGDKHYSICKKKNSPRPLSVRRRRRGNSNTKQENEGIRLEFHILPRFLSLLPRHNILASSFSSPLIGNS